MTVIKTTEKGQIVIPAEIRRELGIKPGQKLIVSRQGEGILLQPLPDDPVDYLLGVCRDQPLWDDLRTERVGERERDKRMGL